MNAFTLAPDMQVELYEIALKMKRRKLSTDFIAAAVNTAVISEEAWYQMKLWDDNKDGPEGDKFLSELKDTIEQVKYAEEARIADEIKKAEERAQRPKMEVVRTAPETTKPAKTSKAPASSAGPGETYIKFTDMDKVKVDVQKFKDALRLLVDEKGGLNELSKATGIPQPSLSRFFSSPSMPRRVTLLKIAKALKMEGLNMTAEW
jgi:DNA-binding phage protein